MDINSEKLLDETGGDIPFADLFIEAANEAVGHVPQCIKDIFYQEVEQHRKNWGKRVNDFKLMV